MKQFISSSKAVEVNAETIYTFIDALGDFKYNAVNILKKFGIENVKPGNWYNQQAWLNSFKEISKNCGNTTLYLVGFKIPDNALFPKDINTVQDALYAINIAYHMNHRGGEIGNYNYEKKTDSSGVMICNNPYPDSFDLGLITSVVRKFNKFKTKERIIINQTKPTRNRGGLSTEFLICW